MTKKMAPKTRVPGDRGKVCRHGSFRSSSRTFAVSTLALCLSGAGAFAESSLPTFDIGEMSASKALQLYSKQSDYQVMYEFDKVGSVRVNGVEGAMSAEQALQKMLAGTGLNYRFGEGRAIVIYLWEHSAVAQPERTMYASNTQYLTDGTPEDQQMAAPEAEETRPTVEEIVITATKRETRLQDTPISITAFSAADLQAGNVQDTWDLMMRTPGMSLSRNGTHAHLYIRGVGTDILGIGNEPSSAVYMDGVYMGRSQSAVTTLLDIDRIEVVRGPQGTLYGRNVVGGAVMLVSKQPTQEFGGEVTAEYGNYDKMRFSGSMNGPIVADKVSARVAFLKDDRDGIIKNVLPGADPSRLDGIDRYGFRGAVSFTPSDAFDLVLSADYIKDDGDGPPLKVLTPGLANDLGAVFNPEAPYVVRQNTDAFREIENWGVSATATWQMEAVTTRAIVAYRQNDWFQGMDSDGTEFDQQNITWGEDQEQFSAELQLLSNDAGPLEWIAGLFYFREDSAMSADLFQPLFGFNLSLPATNTTEAYAGFAQASYEVTDRLKLTAGLRYSWESKNHAADTFILGFPFASAVGHGSWDAFTPKFGIDYRLSEVALLYASITRGFKSGGFNSLGNGEEFDPEYIWSYEMGLKSEWLDRRLLLNVSAFHYDYSDLQVTRWLQNITVVENAASAKVWGGEIEATATPVDDLVLTAGMAFLDAHYSDYMTQNPQFPALGILDLSGNKLRNAPGFTFTSSAEYSWEVMGEYLITARGEYQYQGKVYFNAFNEADLIQSGHDLVNARLTVGNVDGTWDVAVYGQNLFNNQYLTNILRLDSTGYNALGTQGTPRTYGVALSARF